MANSPSYQMYAQDFDMDTATWEIEEIGAYMRLLNYEWINGGLPDNTYKLSKIVRISERKFKKTWENLREKFHLNGNGLLINSRMEEVREKQRKFIESQSQKGKLGGRPPKSPGLSHGLTVEKPDESSSSSSSSSSSIKDKKEKNKHIAKAQKPPSPDVKAFIDFYYRNFEETFLSPPLIEGGKDGSIIKALLKEIPLTELEGLMLKFLDSSDLFIQKSGYTIGVFKSQINKLRIGEQAEVPKHLKGLDKVWHRIQEEEKQNAKETISIPHVPISGSVPERTDE
jgi:uncharacterized protein YdaU (DUF1376 family)